jgi:hypothetical protein
VREGRGTHSVADSGEIRACATRLHPKSVSFIAMSAIRRGRLRLRDYANAGGVEDVGLYFSIAALSGEFFSVQLEAYTGGVSCFHHDFGAGADGGVRRRDQSLFGHGLAIRRDRNP